MSQKVNPNSLRLNVTRNWESEWYAEQKYSIFLQEDLFIREYLLRKLLSRFIVGTCIIQRPIQNFLNIHLMIYSKKYIQRRKIRRIKFELRQIVKKLQLILQKKIKLNLNRIHRRFVKQRRKQYLAFRWRKFFKLNRFLKIMLFRPDIYLIGNFLKDELENLRFHTNLIQFLKREILRKSSLRNENCPLLGIKIQFKGKLNNRRRSRSQTIQAGQMPLSSLDVPMQYHVVHALTRSGVCGIKIWLAYKKKL